MIIGYVCIVTLGDRSFVSVSARKVNQVTLCNLFE